MDKDRLIGLLKKKSCVHFVGIGGISMSALAEILYNRGHKVTGSDINDSDIVEHLRSLGIEVSIGHNGSNVEGADIVINTAAVHSDNVELVRARELGIPTFERSVLLGAVMSNYAYPIAVAGTHGKTTTTSMLINMLTDGGLDPTALVGGVLSAIGGNFRVGKKEDYMVCEACEYVDSFLTLSPRIAVILNVEEDHLDYFSGIEQIVSSFSKFASLPGEEGYVIYNGDSDTSRRSVESSPSHRRSFGTGDGCDFRAENIGVNESGHYEYDLYRSGEYVTKVRLGVPGRHNVYNSLAALCACDVCGIDIREAAATLDTFSGAKRRFEYVGEVNGAKVYDDYAHHPTEIRATLTAAKDMGYSRVICIFQPHTYTRTKALFDQFVSALSLCDVPILFKIFPAREKDVYGISSNDIADRLPGAKCFDDFGSAAEYIRSIAHKGDLIITMGAGDIYKVGEMLIK